MAGPQFPNVAVRLKGAEGNAVLVFGRVRRALRAGGAPKEAIYRFEDEVTLDDYQDLLATVARWVEIAE